MTVADHSEFDVAFPPARAGLSRRTLFRLATALGSGAVIAPLVAACGGPTGSGAATSSAAATGGTAAAAPPAAAGTGATINIVLNRSLVSLDNKLNQFDAAVTVQRAVRQALTAIGTDLKPHPVLAESFEISDDPKVWKVKLRSDIKYSDNSKVTVEDVSTALADYFKVSTGFVASQFPEQPTVSKVDDLNFTLSTKTPVVTLNALMSNILITPAAANKAAELQSGLGTGPFVVSTSNSGTGTYTLVRNPNYWGTPAKLAKVNVSYAEEEATRVIAMQTGTADVIDTISPESAAHLKTVSGVQIIQTPGTRFEHLFYNFRKPATDPISNPKVREALTYAVDHDTLISALMAGQVTSAEGVVPAKLAGAVKTGSYTFDPDKAKSMLAAAGASNIKLVLIWEDSEFSGAPQFMEALSQMLGDVGVTATLKQVPKGGGIADYRGGSKSRDWDVLANGYGNQTGLALTNLVGQYGGTAAQEKTMQTYQGFVVPAISGLLEQAAAEGDETKRNALLATAQNKIWAQWPAMWAWVPNNVLAKRDRVQNLTLSPANSYELAAVSVTS